jgi:uncharacterized phosphosugar-binding protein
MREQGPAGGGAGTAARYFDAIEERLADLRRANASSIPAAAAIVADTVERDGIIRLYGSGHSQLLALEAVGRAGGYAGVHVIFDPGWGRAEQIEGFAATLLRDEVFEPGDCLIVISNSGRNPAQIEVAMAGRAAGLPIIAVTALDYARHSRTRHSSGRSLHELADVVLDTCAPPGDAILEVEGAAVPTGATSTVLGAALLNAVLVESVAELVRRGIEPPLVRSYNLDGSEAHNERVMARYRGRVRPTI